MFFAHLNKIMQREIYVYSKTKPYFLYVIRRVVSSMFNEN